MSSARENLFHREYMSPTVW